MFQRINKKIILIAVLSLAFFCFGIAHADTLSQKVNFFVDPDFDLNNRSQLPATLQRITSHLYFYFDDSWWNSLDSAQQETVNSALNSLSSEFDNNIYPKLTSTFGSEWNPGIDNDSHITILFEKIKEGAGGYFTNANEYYKLQLPTSNEREMVYLNADYVTSPQIKGFLAHEFMHLITFNQKEKRIGIQEDTWLNEARSEYVQTLLGYDDNYSGSNLQRRISTFLEYPSDSITEWRNEKSDYGALNLFTQYLVEHYGIKTLSDSLRSPKIGIASVNEILKNNGLSEDFSQIFVNWTIASFVNDCTLGSQYCYLDKNLSDLRIVPVANFLPMIGESTLSFNNFIKDWTGNWYRFVGGKGTLKLDFAGSTWIKFAVPYVVKDINGNQSVKFITLDKDQKGEISVSDFGDKNIFLTIIPSVQNKLSGFSENDPSYSFSWSASIVKNTDAEKAKEEAELIQKLLAQIESLKKQIADLQAQINAIFRNQGQKISCSKFENNLYFGMKDDSEVRCLQEFLKSKGTAIYAEGLVTGNYFSATLSAVKKYQASKGVSQTGYFGPLTREAANKDSGY